MDKIVEIREFAIPQSTRKLSLMTVDALFYLRTKEPQSALRDLDDVVLTADVEADSGFVVNAGTEGTVVGIWGAGESYEVEFAEPEGTLATVKATDLRRLTPTSD